jgi:outer membrane protein with beta-barrel domain
VFKTMLIGLMILACASLAAAQSDDYKRVEVYGGFSYQLVGNDLDDDDVIPDPEGFRGFNASITGNISRYFGLKADFAGHYKSRPIGFGPLANGIDVDTQRYTYLGGVQIKNNSSESTFKPFVHALVGAVTVRNRVKINNELCIAIAPTPCPADFTEKETGFAAAFGGGVDIRASDRIDFRLFQIDYVPTRLFDGRQHSLRLGIGIVFH